MPSQQYHKQPTEPGAFNAAEFGLIAGCGCALLPLVATLGVLLGAYIGQISAGDHGATVGVVVGGLVGGLVGLVLWIAALRKSMHRSAIEADRRRQEAESQRQVEEARHLEQLASIRREKEEEQRRRNEEHARQENERKSQDEERRRQQTGGAQLSQMPSLDSQFQNEVASRAEELLLRRDSFEESTQAAKKTRADTEAALDLLMVTELKLVARTLDHFGVPLDALRGYKYPGVNEWTERGWILSIWELGYTYGSHWLTADGTKLYHVLGSAGPPGSSDPLAQQAQPTLESTACVFRLEDGWRRSLVRPQSDSPSMRGAIFVDEEGSLMGLIPIEGVGVGV